MIQVNCLCGQQFDVEDASAGRPVACPGCGVRQVAPRRDAQAVTDEPAPGHVPQGRAAAPYRRGEEFAPEPRRPPSSNSGLAVASLVMGLVSLVGGLVAGLPILLGIPAVITGLVAVRRINRSQGRQTGKGLAIAGMVTGALSSLCMFTVVPVLGYFVWRAVWEQAAWAESQNNLRQIQTSMWNYASTNNCFPPQATSVPFKPGEAIVPGNPNGPPKVQPAVSWRVLLLPYMEDEIVYDQFNLQEPWDSPQNQGPSSRAVKVYQMPRDTSVPANHTFYQVCYGDETKNPHALFDAPAWRQPGFGQRGAHLAQISDGTSNTLLIAEAATAVPWAKPADIYFDPDQPPPTLGNHFSRGTQVITADGTIHALPKTLPAADLKALITRDGGEINNIPDW